jgi:hypothetical protein
VRFRLAVRAASSVAWLLIASFELGAGDWVVPAVAPEDAAPGIMRVVGTINLWFSYGVLIFMACCALQAFSDVRRYFRGEPSALTKPNVPAAELEWP